MCFLLAHSSEKAKLFTFYDQDTYVVQYIDLYITCYLQTEVLSGTHYIMYSLLCIILHILPGQKSTSPQKTVPKVRQLIPRLKDIQNTEILKAL
jgi:hypothetical protein